MMLASRHLKVEEVFVSDIDIPPRLRAVDADKVKSLAQSIEAIGLQQPITLYAIPDGAFQIVAGAHRFEAVRTLGWEAIDAVFTTADEIDRQLWEIDENLMRAELSPTQQAEHLAKRKELWGARQESGANHPTLTGRGNKQFAQATAEATGVDKRNVNKAVARAEKVPQDIRDEIRGTDLDKGVVLDRIARAKEDEKREVFESIREGGAVHNQENETRLLGRLFAAWRNCPRDAQERFLDALRNEGRIG